MYVMYRLIININRKARKTNSVKHVICSKTLNVTNKGTCNKNGYKQFIDCIAIDRHLPYIISANIYITPRQGNNVNSIIAFK